jgi:hypothetical protein
MQIKDFNPDFAFRSGLRGQNARKSIVDRMRHYIAIVNKLNESKRLMLNRFAVQIGI